MCCCGSLSNAARASSSWTTSLASAEPLLDAGFTQLESLERDAVVKALVIHRGNKDKAASDLGMSRATIYRKIRDYGIVLTI